MEKESALCTGNEGQVVESQGKTGYLVKGLISSLFPLISSYIFTILPYQVIKGRQVQTSGR